MTTTSAATRAPTAWLHGPASDVLLGAGALYLGSIPLLFWIGSHGTQAWPIWLAALIALLVSGPHYGATLLRVYERREDRRRYVLFAVWVTLALVALLLVGVQSPGVGSLLITAYVTWSPWHFAGQNYGVSLLFLRRRSVVIDASAKRLLYASFVLSALLTILVLHAGGPVAQVGAAASLSVGYGVVPLGIPPALGNVLLPIVGVLYALATLGALAMLGRAAGPAIGLVALVVGTQAMWFVVPAFWYATGELRPLAFAAIWISGAHALQYLWVTSYYARLVRPEQRGPSYFGKALCAGAAYTGVPALLLAPGLLGAVPFDAGLAAVVFAATNLHHFILDGAIWKLRDGRVARVLLFSEGAAENSGYERRWLGAALAVVGLVFLCVAVFDMRQRVLAETADAARLVSLNEQLRWVGRESPALYLTAGARFEQRGDLEGAAALYRRSLALHPSADGFSLLAGTHVRSQQNAAAIEAYEQALSLQPGLPRAMQGLAVALLREGRPEEALPLLEALESEASDSPLLDRQLRLARQRVEAARSP